MKTALVCGASGFIGHHLIRKLKKEGYWVRGVGRKSPEFSQTTADEFLFLDLRTQEGCRKALKARNGCVDEVYQLAADMGGIGFISSEECEIMKNNALINIHMIDSAVSEGVKRYFFLPPCVSIGICTPVKRNYPKTMPFRPILIINMAGKNFMPNTLSRPIRKNSGSLPGLHVFKLRLGPRGHGWAGAKKPQRQYAGKWPKPAMEGQ